MRSFTFALIAAAFATLISAAPVASPPGLLGRSSFSNTVDVVGTVKGLFKGKTNSLAGGVRARAIPVVNDLSLPKVPRLSTRGELCLDVIIDEVSTGVHSSVEQLQRVSSSDDIKIKGIVAVIKGRIDAAIPQVKALVGDEKDTIMVSVDGQVMTVDHVAKLLASILKPILTAVGFLLKVVDDDVKVLLGDLITDVFVFVGGILGLVDGLAAALGPLITDVGDVIVALGVDISQYGLTC